MPRRDNPVVRVFDGNLDAAIRLLKRKVANYGTYGKLKFRSSYIRRGEKKRAKQLRHRKKLQRARARGNL